MKFDKKVYEKQALLKTAYHFTDRVYIHLSQDDEAWIVSWCPKEEDHLREEEFENELISQQLRLELTRETNDVRKILLARAMASTMMNVPVSAEEAASSPMEDDSVLKDWFHHDGV